MKSLGPSSKVRAIIPFGSGVGVGSGGCSPSPSDETEASAADEESPAAEAVGSAVPSAEEACSPEAVFI